MTSVCCQQRPTVAPTNNETPSMDVQLCHRYRSARQRYPNDHESPSPQPPCFSLYNLWRNVSVFRNRVVPGQCQILLALYISLNYLPGIRTASESQLCFSPNCNASLPALVVALNFADSMCLRSQALPPVPYCNKSSSASGSSVIITSLLGLANNLTLNKPV